MLKAKEYGLGDPNDPQGGKAACVGGLTSPIDGPFGLAGNFAPDRRSSHSSPWRACARSDRRATPRSLAPARSSFPGLGTNQGQSLLLLELHDRGWAPRPGQCGPGDRSSRATSFFYNAGTPEPEAGRRRRDLHYRDSSTTISEQLGDTALFHGAGHRRDREESEPALLVWVKALGIDLPGEADGLVPDERVESKTYSGGLGLPETPSIPRSVRATFSRPRCRWLTNTSVLRQRRANPFSR